MLNFNMYTIIYFYFYLLLTISQVCQKFLRNQKYALKGNISTKEQILRATTRKDKKTKLMAKFTELKSRKKAAAIAASKTT